MFGSWVILGVTVAHDVIQHEQSEPRSKSSFSIHTHTLRFTLLHLNPSANKHYLYENTLSCTHAHFHTKWLFSFRSPSWRMAAAFILCESDSSYHDRVWFNIFLLWLPDFLVIQPVVCVSCLGDKTLTIRKTHQLCHLYPDPPVRQKL